MWLLAVWEAAQTGADSFYLSCIKVSTQRISLHISKSLVNLLAAVLGHKTSICASKAFWTQTKK